jgi:hypothetical protein
MTDPCHDYPTHLLLGATSPSHSHVPQLSLWLLQPLPPLKAFQQAPASLVSTKHHSTRIVPNPVTKTLRATILPTAKDQSHSHSKSGDV